MSGMCTFELCTFGQVHKIALLYTKSPSWTPVYTKKAPKMAVGGQKEAGDVTTRCVYTHSASFAIVYEVVPGRELALRLLRGSDEPLRRLVGLSTSSGSTWDALGLDGADF